MRLKTTFAAAIVSCASALAVATPSASASDPGACAFNGRTIVSQREYQCSLWRGNVPVYSSAWTGTPIVGYLYAGGRANWFVAQCVGVTAHLGPYVNHWWAHRRPRPLGFRSLDLLRRRPRQPSLRCSAAA